MLTKSLQVLPVDIVDVDARAELHDENPLRGQVPVNLGDLDRNNKYLNAYLIINK